MTDTSFTRSALRMSSGVLAWALHFAVVYGGTGIACARMAPHVVPWIIALATAVAAAACVAAMVSGLRAADRFEGWITSTVAALALLAIVWEAVPVLVVAPCA